MLEIGESIIFMFKGEKIWEGTKDNILNTEVKDLQDFIFASKLIRDMKS
jgi:phospholipid/cholesterol/gamma-HCH transport system ATP-binding protein